MSAAAEQLTEERYAASIPWLPQEGPQTEAMFSPADVVLYGGAAGGGKTALACGMAITRHQHSLIMRREATQLKGIYREIAEIIDPRREGFSKQAQEWKIPAWDGVQRMVMFGSCPHPGDEAKWQGIARDLLVLDEAANFLYSQAMFLMGWTRSTTTYQVEDGAQNFLSRKQRTRVLLCSNPPTNAEGQWLFEMFAAWLDPEHPNPAMPGELRYYTTVGGVMEEQPNGDPIENPSPVGDEDRYIYPKSFTFIPAKTTDNEYLGAEYLRELQALPEPLRSQMLYGDFSAGMEDDEWQAIPSDWVKAAQARWEPREFDQHRITSVGCDPSRGGRDKTVNAYREDWYFHPLQRLEGQDCDTGGKVAIKLVEAIGLSHCPVHVDKIGIGASVVDHLVPLIGSRCVSVDAAGRTEACDWSGTLRFVNNRARLVWNMRDLLNPENGQNVALPRDQRLLADLCSYRYEYTSQGIKVEDKKQQSKRLGRSPDDGDAVLLAAERTAVMFIEGHNPAPQVQNTR